MIASSSSVWAWLAAAADTGVGALAAATAAHPAVRVAVGPIGAGIDGFRRSHFNAVATQRVQRLLAVGGGQRRGDRLVGEEVAVLIAVASGPGLVRAGWRLEGPVGVYLQGSWRDHDADV